MAVVFIMNFPEASQEKYDNVIRDLDLETTPAAGGLVHMAGPSPDGRGWRVVDVWESQAAFDTFLRDRLGAAMQKNGVSEPQVESFTTHNGFIIGNPGPVS
jgi:hypothetical protein